MREKVSQLQTNFNFFVGMLLQEGRLHLPADERVVESKGVKKFEFFANLASQSHRSVSHRENRRTTFYEQIKLVLEQEGRSQQSKKSVYYSYDVDRAQPSESDLGRGTASKESSFEHISA